MDSKEDVFNLAPIQGRLANTDSYLAELFDDNVELEHNAPVPTPEEAEQERKNARKEVEKMFSAANVQASEIKPSSGDEMKGAIAISLRDSRPSPYLVKDDGAENMIPPSMPLRSTSSSHRGDPNMEKRIESIVAAYDANLTLKDAEENMELDAEDDENLNTFLGEDEYYESGENNSLGTKGSNIPGQSDGLVETQHDHANWLSYLSMLFESETLILHPDYQNDLEHKFHEQGLTERDVGMYCLGLKRERNLSVMKQIDGLVERLSTCLDSAVTVKTGMSSLLEKHEELMIRMFDTLKQTPSVSSASVESAAPPPARRPPNSGGAGRGRRPVQNLKWETGTDKSEVIKKQQGSQGSPSKRENQGTLTIKGNQEKDQKSQEVWRKKPQQPEQKKKGKLSLTATQEQIVDLIGIPKEIYLSEKFIPYISKLLDEDTLENIRGMDPEEYPTLRKVFMDLIWRDYEADNPAEK